MSEVTGVAVMGIELSASRLIAPYFGTSLYVWTNVIAVILAALSLGYYLGGRWSERSPQLFTLLKVLIVAGVLLAIIPFIVRPVASVLAFDFTLFSSASLMIVLGSFLLTIVLFFLPIMLLGMTSPFLIKLVSLERKDLGNVAGRIFAVSTVGSIIGTFLPALIFIPLVGTKFTILIFAAVIILMGVVGLAPSRLFIVVPFLAVLFGTLDTSLKSSVGLIAEAESPYQYMQVIESDDARYLIYNEGGGVQSIYHPYKTFSGGLGTYFDAAALLPTLTEGKRVLLIGVAGGTISRAMQALYGDDPDFHVDGVEIDPEVAKIATEYFELDQPDLTMYFADGRQAVTMMGEGKYDVIFVDAFTNQLYIPFHLATQEFFNLVHDRLAPGGVLGMNVNALDADSELLVAVTNTVASVFKEVRRVPVGIGNHVIVAGDKPIPLERLALATFAESEFQAFAPTLSARSVRIAFDAGKRVLTDDLAPLEYLTDKMFWDYFISRLHE